MKYCSECGTTLEWRRTHGDDRERFLCGGCGMTHYQNPRVIVGCIAHWGNRLLLCRRAIEPAVGEWTFPAGFLENGETLQAGAAREMYEETGLMVDPADLHLYAVASMPGLAQVGIAFRSQLVDEPPLQAGPESSEVALLTEQQIFTLQLAWPDAMSGAVSRFFAELRTGVFAIHLQELSAQGGKAFAFRDYLLACLRPDHRDDQ